MVPSRATNGTHHQPPTTEQRCTKSICACPCSRATQLHETPVCTSGTRGDGPRQAQGQTILGRLRRHWFQHWDSNASLMLSHLHCENQGNKNQRHSVLSTPINHKPTDHTWNTCHKGGIGPHQCIKRNGLTRWQDGRGTQKVKQIIHEDSRGKIRIGKGKRATNQPPKTPQCPPSGTTSKGGR